jgi:hypothetical protein
MKIRPRFSHSLGVALATSLLSLGCGGSNPTAQNGAQNTATTAVNSLAELGPNGAASSVPLKSSAVDVVSQFLDAIRRGGDSSAAEEWLTRRAQAELSRIGHKLEPIGSPDAKFTVTRAESLPESPGEALVHSYWEEPNTQGATSQSQVVWAVVWERDTWKISGFAVQVDPNSDPVILDFENGDLMANYLNPTPENASGPASASPTTARPSDGQNPNATSPAAAQSPVTANNGASEISR